MSRPVLGEPPAPFSLLDRVLAEQRSLSAVDLFVRRQAAGALPGAARIYEDHVPSMRGLTPGRRLAFRVDLEACTGCKACVTACHRLNGLAADEAWRDVGLVLGRGSGGCGAQQTVTTTCHHCEDPGCLAGCPVQAYEQDEVTGIVRHLDDQCIGCRYCLLKCPYDVPKYNAELGIVRKCDMCAGRLADGEAPACVQGCPNGAISIEIVDRGAPAEESPPLIPGVHGLLPDSSYTRPTTRFVSRRPGAVLRPADLDRVTPAEAHDPLAVMLVLMQLSVGLLFFDTGMRAVGWAVPAASAGRWGLSAVAAVAGLLTATFHLGRPFLAFRAFLGWRTSWMSREVIAFGVFVPVVISAAGMSARLAWGGGAGEVEGFVAEVLPALRLFALGLGGIGTICSVMVYVDTRRFLWRSSSTGPLFAGTLLGLGGVGVTAAGAWFDEAGGDPARLAPLWAGLGVLGLKLVGEMQIWAEPRRSMSDPSARTARLLHGPLVGRVRWRVGLAAAGFVGALAVVACGRSGAPVPAGLFAAFALGSLLAAEAVERHLFFTAEASHRMPGL